MRKSLLILLFTCLYLSSFGQILKGTIKDVNTGEVINYASIYINGTFVGTNSDIGGNFELDISRYPAMPLTISALGYYSLNIPNLDPYKKLEIYLTPKLFELSEVVINAKKISRERRNNMGYFKREFLGITMNASNCTIKNEDDITFSHDSSGDTLIAISLKPILIENNALGYNLVYYLDIFKYSKKTGYILITGNCIFNEDLSIDKSLQEKYDRRRRSAYLGSRMHFIKSLWANTQAVEGFVVKDINYKVLSPDKYLCQTVDTATGVISKFLCNQKTMTITYYTRGTSSQIILNNDSIYFDKDGYFDPLGISWQGEMARQRIADLLPFEY
ncbi:MAG: carboxypeptidase-like regulatory domain-containing protein [Bacteroidales bacterium]|nr:carboxypeptidase-like regulatory domain-containing protein [Bacteroidales bacterium]MBK7625771.1 carboxypeptidase-like regulatory domain-containing protein [Bacteroidales bacterium]